MAQFKISRLRKKTFESAQVNLTPLVDCFTVLTTYLLAGISIVTLSWLGANISSPNLSQHVPTDSLPKQQASVVIRSNNLIEYSILINQEVQRGKLPAAGTSEADWKSLSALLSDLGNNKDSKIFLNADPDVKYNDILLAVNKLQNYGKVVLLGGLSL